MEPVRVLYTIQGSTPPNNCNTACFGWAGSELGDVGRDHRPDLLATAANGETVYVIAGDEEDR